MRRAARAFTVIELLVVIVIILVLTSFLIVGLTGIEERARLSDAAAKVQRIEAKIRAYFDERQKLPDIGPADDRGTTVNENPPTLFYSTFKAQVQAAVTAGSNVTIPVNSVAGFLDGSYIALPDRYYYVRIYDSDHKLVQKAKVIGIDPLAVPPTLDVERLGVDLTGPPGGHYVTPETVFEALNDWSDGKYAVKREDCLDRWGNPIHVALQPDYLLDSAASPAYRTSIDLVGGSRPFVLLDESGQPYNNEPGGFQVLSAGPDGEWHAYPEGEALPEDKQKAKAENEDNVTNIPGLPSYYGKR